MPISTYTKIYPCDEKLDHRILYSTLKASVVRVPAAMIPDIEAGRLTPDQEKLFSDLKLITQDKKAEQQEMLDGFKKRNARSKKFDITAVLTLDCNFACTYCFENRIKSHQHMSQQTAEELIRFVKAQWDQFAVPKEHLTVNFYGGEPLLKTDLIRYISERLKSFAEGKGAQYDAILTTNGSLLTRNTVEFLLPFGLTLAAITLDGPKTIHDRSRPFANGTGSFERVIGNAAAVCDLIRIGISGNFLQKNYMDFLPLLDELEKAGLTPDRIDSLRFMPVSFEPVSNTGCSSFNESWLIHPILTLREVVLSRGYYTPKPGPLHCMIETDDLFVVHWDGAVYKCPALIGIEEFAVGHVNTGLDPQKAARSHGLEIWKNKECLACPYLPQCFGGCRQMAYFRDGRIGRDCMKPFLDAALESLVKQDLRYRPA